MSSKHLSRVRGGEFLQRAFATEQTCLLANLRSSDRIAHDGDRGEVNEQFFIEMFRRYLPNRYTVDKASVLDSEGRISDSIDVVVYDRQYTPALLDSDKHRYVPVEAVYAIFECKPVIDKRYLKYAAKKAESVRRLKWTSVPIPTARGTWEPKEDFCIVSGILAIDVDWQDGLGQSFEQCHQTHVDNRKLDCGLAVGGASFDTFDTNDEDSSYTYCTGDNALAFFLFRLLHRLRSLATAPAADWNAYASQLMR